MHPRVKERHTALTTEARGLIEGAGAGRLEGDAQQRFDAITAELDQLRVDSERYETLDRHLAAGHVESGDATNVNTRTSGKPWEVRDWRDADELAGRAVDALERAGAEDGALARVRTVIDAHDGETPSPIAQRIAATSSPAYARAFMKLVADPSQGHNRWTHDEREAMQRAMEVGTGSAGGYAVPVALDPSFILTNNGSSNALRQLARPVTLTNGNTWHGISTAGVTASYDAEYSQVSDDTPTLAQPTIPTYMARAWVPFSMEAADDIANLQTELLTLFVDARDRLEENKFSVGSGTAEPTGLWTKVNATSGCKVTSTASAAIALADIHGVYKALPIRYRRNSTWLANPAFTLAIKALGTAVSATFSGDIRVGTPGDILGRPVAESDDAPSAQTTTALDPEVILGDFSRFVIVDRLGMQVELVPHTFDSANLRPNGGRGLFARWRSGSDVVDTNGFKVLVNKTSA